MLGTGIELNLTELINIICSSLLIHSILVRPKAMHTTFKLSTSIRKWGSANGLRLVRMAQICEWCEWSSYEGQKKNAFISLIFLSGVCGSTARPFGRPSGACRPPRRPERSGEVFQTLSGLRMGIEGLANGLRMVRMWRICEWCELRMDVLSFQVSLIFLSK